MSLLLQLMSRAFSRLHIPDDSLGSPHTIIGRADVTADTYNVRVDCQTVSCVSPPPAMLNLTMNVWAVAS